MNIFLGILAGILLLGMFAESINGNYARGFVAVIVAIIIINVAMMIPVIVH